MEPYPIFEVDPKVLEFYFFCQNHNYILFKWEEMGSNPTSNPQEGTLHFNFIKKSQLKAIFQKAHNTK
jgi:hypothetical protein